MSRLRLVLGDKRTAALLLGSGSGGLPEDAALPPPPPPPIGAELPRWAVEGEERKRGAGVLFFAYGGLGLGFGLGLGLGLGLGIGLGFAPPYFISQGEGVARSPLA